MSPPTGLLLVAAATLAGAAVLLLAPARARLPVAAEKPRPRTRFPPAGAGPPVVGGAALVVAVRLTDASLPLVAVGAGCGLATWQAWRRHRSARLRDRRRARVVEVGEALVGELQAGRPAPDALGRAVDLWPELAPVAAAARLGADVPGALREQARLPGAEGLADLAAAWQVSQRSGAALAATLSQVVASARARATAGHLVRGELASARATARLVAVLPAGTWLMSAGTGGDAWGFLVGHPVGLGCLAAGTALVFAGLAWIDRIAAAVDRP